MRTPDEMTLRHGIAPLMVITRETISLYRSAASVAMAPLAPVREPLYGNAWPVGRTTISVTP